MADVGSRWRSYRSCLIAPWFVYQYRLEGNGLLRVMFARARLARFTTSLDPGHVHPWNFYYVTMFRQLGYSGTTWLAVAGGVRAARRTPSAGRRSTSCSIVYWFVIPVALMSIGTSKLHHYAVSVPAAARARGGIRPGVVLPPRDRRWIER